MNIQNILIELTDLTYRIKILEEEECRGPSKHEIFMLVKEIKGLLYKAVDEAKKVDNAEQLQIKESQLTISDGYSAWSKVCPSCGEAIMEVVRPGKVQCGNCD